MKPKKTYKSLTELSADSFGEINAQNEKTKLPEPQLLAEPQPKIPPSNSPLFDVRGYHRWGINE